MLGQAALPKREWSHHLQVDADQTASTRHGGFSKSTLLFRMACGLGCFALGIVSTWVAPPLASHDESPQKQSHNDLKLGFNFGGSPLLKPSARAYAQSMKPRTGFRQVAGRTSMIADAGVEGAAQKEGDGTFYTDAVKKESYPTLDEILGEKMKDKELAEVLKEMFGSISIITETLRNELVCVSDEQCSVFGDVQLSVDMLADKVMWDAVQNTPLIKEGASEEAPEVREVHKDGKFSIVWDPLDGSQIVDNNWAVGSIIGIWPASTGIVGATGRDQVTSLVAVYGPRTTVYVSLDDGVYEFTYAKGAMDSWFGWMCSKERIQIKPTSKIYSPGNTRSLLELEGYDKLLTYYKNEQYALRYTGGLVPDVTQQFTKEMGIYTWPTSEKWTAKLRLAFEAAPFALLIEKAGGKSSNTIDGGSILDMKITGIDQRTGLAFGSALEIDRFNEMTAIDHK